MRNSVQCLPIGQLEMLGSNELERLDLLPRSAQQHAAGILLACNTSMQHMTDSNKTLRGEIGFFRRVRKASDGVAQ